MPELDANGVRLYYEERGRGEETIVFSHSYLLDHRHFEPQIRALEDRYRIIAYDHREHGRSGCTGGAFGIDDLVADGAAIIERVAGGECHWVGLSTGGFVGMRLGFRRPDLLRSLVLMDTSAEIEARYKRLKYHAMLLALRFVGVKPLAGEAMRGLFGETFLGDPAREGERAVWRERVEANTPEGISRFGRAIWGRDRVLERLNEIQAPTLVVHGEEDTAFFPDYGVRIKNTIPGAKFVLVAHAGHVCTIEAPEVVNKALEDFYASLG